MSATKKLTTALYVDENAVSTVIRDRVVSEPAKGEIQVEVLYSGVSAADLRHATDLGMRPTVLGYDFMGKVLKAGPESDFAAGDLVAGYTMPGVGRSMRYGTHQQYLANPEDLTWHVPPNVPAAHAAALTLSVATAADALFHAFGFPFPGKTHPNPGFRYGPLLIWGAATTVGIAMLQLGRACGASHIFVVASPERHGLLTEYGAARCFDYSDPDVVLKIKAAVDEEAAGEIAWAADCIGSRDAADKIIAATHTLTRRASVMPFPVEGFGRAIACRSRMVTEQFMTLPSRPRFTSAPQPQMQANIWKALNWVIENYGTRFELPVVDIFEGRAEEALEQLRLVAGCGRFGKLVFKHPLI